MTKRSFTVMLALATMVAAAGPRAWGQENADVGYVLYRVASMPNTGGLTKFKAPTLLQADVSGGLARVTLDYARPSFISETTRPCSELVEFTWKFNHDMSFLRPSETFSITLSSRKGSECGREHYSQPSTSLIIPAITRTLTAQEGAEFQPVQWVVGLTDAETRVRTTEGAKSFALRALGVPSAPRRMYFIVNLFAFSDIEQFAWQIVYMYQAVQPGTPAGPVPVRNDSPGANSPSTVRIPRPGERVPPAGGTTTSTAGGSDAAAGGVTAGGATGGGGSSPGTPGTGTTGSGAGTAGSDTATSASGGGTSGSGGGTPGTTSGGSGVGTGGASPPTGGQSGAPDASRRTLLAERRTVETGHAVTVPARLLLPAGVANVNFEVAYDSSVVRVERVARGSLLGATTLLEQNAQEAGRIRIGFAGESGLTASGIVANLGLRAVGRPGSRTPLTLKVTEINDAAGANLPVDLVHGEVIIAGPGGRVPGDCDGDSEMTAADALCALKMSVGLIPVDLVLDANNDRQVTSGDARTILQRIP
ncbi:MAG: cohesin domain-containing protein [Vicinamibacterales bacterium]